MSQSSRQQRQWIIAGILGFLLLAGLWFISQILNNQQGTFTGARGESGINTSIIADRTRAASPEMSWINNASSKVDQLTADVQRLEDALRTSQQQAEARIAQEESESDRLLASYENTIKTLQSQLAASPRGAQADPAKPTRAGGTVIQKGANALNEFLHPSSARGPNPLGNLGRPTGQNTSPSAQTTQGTTASSGPGVTPIAALPFARDFALVSSSNEDGDDKHPPHLKDYLPAGSYAPATVLSGVDASTAVTSQAEPVPVVFRITGPAVTAGTRSTRGHTIDLTGCTVTGSARGDLSSERVYVRLLKLSCVQAGNHVFERDVAGYMSGAGKAGARGRVVSREGPLVRNAGIAGALSGLAEGVSGVTSAGAGADAASFNEALSGAGAASVSGGISGAANRLSEYYIERAEQYQPVVSLYGGTQVELVFLEGVDLG